MRRTARQHVDSDYYPLVRIAELSSRSGTTIPSIKFYLREGLLPAGAATGRNQADYAEAHVQPAAPDPGPDRRRRPLGGGRPRRADRGRHRRPARPPPARRGLLRARPADPPRPGRPGLAGGPRARCWPWSGRGAGTSKPSRPASTGRPTRSPPCARSARTTCSACCRPTPTRPSRSPAEEVDLVIARGEPAAHGRGRGHRHDPRRGAAQRAAPARPAGRLARRSADSRAD